MSDDNVDVPKLDSIIASAQRFSAQFAGFIQAAEALKGLDSLQKQMGEAESRIGLVKKAEEEAQMAHQKAKAARAVELDAIIAEGRATAERLKAQAQEPADRLLAAAKAKADKVAAEAEQLRVVCDDRQNTVRNLEAQIARLTADHDKLSADYQKVRASYATFLHRIWPEKSEEGQGDAVR